MGLTRVVVRLRDHATLSPGVVTHEGCSGLFRLWVVLTLLWLAVAAAYIVVAYQNAPEHDL
jgi:hypothetical protein